LEGDRIVVGGTDGLVIVFDCRPPSFGGPNVRDRYFREALSRFTPGFHLNAAERFGKADTADPYAAQFHKKWSSFAQHDVSDYSDWDWYDLIDAYTRKDADLARQARQEFQSRFEAKKRATAITLSSVFADTRFGVLTAPALIDGDRKRFAVLA